MGGGALRRPTHRCAHVERKYAACDRVIAVAGTSNENIRPRVFTIVKTLPSDGRGWRYRARNALDTHERVLDEDLLQSASG